jgi:hypothetical protein
MIELFFFQIQRMHLFIFKTLIKRLKELIVIGERNKQKNKGKAKFY